MLSKSTKGILFVLTVILALLTGGCSGKNAGPFSGREAAVLKGYDSMKEYKDDIYMSHTTVKEVAELMNKGKSFAVYAGFENCPYCNRLLPELCDVAREEGIWLGYLDTRKDPSWKSNVDIEDYDLFVELFGDYLQLDNSQIKHLYVPVVIFVKEGKTLEFRQGVVEGADNPSNPLTDSQREQLRRELKEFFEKIK